MQKQNDYELVKRAFLGFVSAWERGSLDNMDEFIAADLMASFSMFPDGCLSRETLKARLGSYSQRPEYTRLAVNNFVCLTDGLTARQSAGIAGVFTDSSGDKRYWFTGLAAATFRKSGRGWIMTELRFDLLNDNTVKMARDADGRLSIAPTEEKHFVNNWLPINDRVGWFQKCPLPRISGEYDAPWYAVKKRDDRGDDRQQIEELFYRYCFALDVNTFTLWHDIFTPDAIVNFALFGPMDVRRATDVMKLMREEVARRTHHMGYFTKLIIHGGEARAEICRVISGEHYAENLSREIREAATVSFYMNAVKDDGMWLIKEIGSIPKNKTGRQ